MDVYIDPRWSQGSLLHPDTLGGAGVDLDIGEDDIVVIISQDCDVVSSSIQAEPLLEIHVARRIAQLNGNFTSGKNPRTLDFEEGTGPDVRRYRCRDADRRRLDRRLLEGSTPAGSLSEENIRQLAQWTARRFTRVALPDEFNRRLASGREKFSGLARAGGDSLSAIYIMLSKRTELPADQSYRVVLVGAVRWQDRIAVARHTVTAIAALLDSLPGIEVDDDDVLMEEDISVADLRQLLRLDFDYISIRNNEEAAPEG